MVLDGVTRHNRTVAPTVVQQGMAESRGELIERLQRVAVVAIGVALSHPPSVLFP